MDDWDQGQEEDHFYPEDVRKQPFLSTSSLDCKKLLEGTLKVRQSESIK